MLADLTVAVIHYQTPDVLDNCLERLLPFARGARVIVVDTSDSYPLSPGWSEDGVELLRTANRGYSSAVNAALAITKTPYFVHMNADVYLHPQTLPDLLNVLDSTDDCAIAGPLVTNVDGGLQDQGLPYRWWQWRVASGIALWRAASSRTGRSLTSLPVPWLSGCIQAVRMSAVELAGPMDESQRFTNEETDWCLRMQRAGFSCRLVDTGAVHLGGVSTPSHPAFLMEGLRGSMVVNRRFAPAWRTGLQRYAVWGWASLASVFGVRPRFRAAARAVQTMFREQSYSQPVFGETLAEPLLPQSD